MYPNSTNFNDLRLVKLLLTTDEIKEFGSYVIKLLTKLNFYPKEFSCHFYRIFYRSFLSMFFLFILSKFCHFLSHYLTLQLKYVLCLLYTFFIF